MSTKPFLRREQGAERMAQGAGRMEQSAWRMEHSARGKALVWGIGCRMSSHGLSGVPDVSTVNRGIDEAENRSKILN